MSAPGLLWLASAVCAAVSVALLRRGPAAGGGWWPARIPVPAALARLGARPGDGDLVRAAALPPHVTPQGLARARVACAAMAVAGVAALSPVLGVLAAAAAPAAAAAAFVAPGRAAAARAAARRRAMVRELPDVLDLVAISVEAGMAVDPALDMAAARLGGDLAAEISVTRRHLALGTPRRDAYRDLADRTGAPEMRQVVAALLQAEELGAPLSAALAAHSAALRAARRQAARDRAARAAPRIQLVVALVMVPAALLMVLGVLAMELARQMGAVL